MRRSYSERNRSFDPERNEGNTMTKCLAYWRKVEQFIKNEDFEGFRKWCASEKSQAYDEWRVAKFRMEHPELSAKAETGVKMWLPLLAKEKNSIREQVVQELKKLEHIEMSDVERIIYNVEVHNEWVKHGGPESVEQFLEAYPKAIKKYDEFVREHTSTCPSGVCAISPDFSRFIEVHVSKGLYPKIQAKAEEWELTIQETIIKILRERLEKEKKE